MNSSPAGLSFNTTCNVKHHLALDHYPISYLGYFVTMGLMGFWHGLTWYYILYGFYHAALLVGYDLFDRWNKQRGGIGKGWQHLSDLASMGVTFNLVCFGLLLFSGHLVLPL